MGSLPPSRSKKKEVEFLPASPCWISNLLAPSRMKRGSDLPSNKSLEKSRGKPWASFIPLSSRVVPKISLSSSLRSRGYFVKRCLGSELGKFPLILQVLLLTGRQMSEGHMCNCPDRQWMHGQTARGDKDQDPYIKWSAILVSTAVFH